MDAEGATELEYVSLTLEEAEEPPLERLGEANAARAKVANKGRSREESTTVFVASVGGVH